jgi:phage-related protein
VSAFSRTECPKSQEYAEKKHYRLFAFWDKTDNKETFVLATHGIIKKTKKTPKSEIKKAEEIRKIYFKLKKQEK